MDSVPDSKAEPGAISALSDAEHLRTLLIAAAREERSVSYSELLGLLGFRFTRPKMRAICKTLGAVDVICAEKGEPDLAVLVVRESDGLPGQGWWIGGTVLMLGYAGAWEGAAAQRFIRTQQSLAFAYWAKF